MKNQFLSFKPLMLLSFTGFFGLICTNHLFAEPIPIPVYQEVAKASGINHTYGKGTDFVVGGGATNLDCNGDGAPELFLAGGGHPAAFYVNDGQGRFRLNNRLLGTTKERLLRVTGAYALDYDGDELQDLFVLRFGQNLLLKAKDDCTFVDVTDQALPKREDWTTAFAARATHETVQGFDQMVVGNYVDRSKRLSKDDNCTPSYVLNRKSDATGFVFQESLLGDSFCALSMLFVDLNGGGSQELRVANDREYYNALGREQIFKTKGKGFEEIREDQGWSEPKLWGMGLAATKLPTGNQALSVTNMAENHFQVFEPNQYAFTNQAFERGVSSHRPYTGGDVRPSTSWHNQFADLNNDGFDDLLIIKGNVEAMPQFAQNDPDSLLLSNGKGQWIEAGDKAQINHPTKGRGATIADFNADGCLDIVVVNRDQPTSLFLNANCDELPKVPDSGSNPHRSVGGGHAGG